MQQAVFMAHCPYELGDRVEIVMIDGMAVTGYPSRVKSGKMTITDILTVHSLKNGVVSFLYELDGHKKTELIPWQELTRKNTKP